jgi:hypothetical protein
MPLEERILNRIKASLQRVFDKDCSEDLFYLFFATFNLEVILLSCTCDFIQCYSFVFTAQLVYYGGESP